MLSVKIRITGNTEEIARLHTLGDKLNDFTAPLKQIGTELKTYYGKTVFGSGGGALGAPWRELSPAYKAWKAKHYPNKGILVASGKMQKSFRAVSDKHTLTIDNTAPYFPYHQSGTNGTRVIRSGSSGLTGRQMLTNMASVAGTGYNAARATKKSVILYNTGRGHGMPARPMLGVTEDVLNIVGGIIKIDIEKKIASAR